MTTAARPVVVRDTFPCEVSWAGRIIRPARVLITTDRVLVFTSKNGQPHLEVEAGWNVSESTVPSVHAPRSEAAHLTLEDGSAAHVNRAKGCGCGNPLKAAPLSTLLPGAVRGTL